MGLDTTHNAWHGSYGSFMVFRKWLAKKLGIPLELMEGYYSEESFRPNMFKLLDYKFPKGDELEMSGIRELRGMLPLKWEAFKESPLHEFLYHSDCEGDFEVESCKNISLAMTKILNDIDAEGGPKEEEKYWYDKLKQFADGFWLAYEKKEKLEFH